MAIVNQTQSETKGVLWIYADRPMMSRALSDIITHYYGRNTSPEFMKSTKNKEGLPVGPLAGQGCSGPAVRESTARY